MGTGRSYNSPVRHVRPGESVTAGVTSRSTRALEQRSTYLKDRLDAIEQGRALIDADVTLSSDVLVGTPVYWNSTNMRYEPALAATTLAQDGSLEFSTSAFCVGICTDKSTSTSGSITLFGLATIPTLSNATTDTTPGLYYISSINAGKLTRARPQVAIPACYVLGAKDACDTNVTILVLPQFGSFFDDHIHYRFVLDPVPAGTAELTDGVYTIVDADANLPGWLPADHAVFNGTAPVGAYFGYNLNYDSKLAGVWPPVPLSGATLIWDKADAFMGRIVSTAGVNRQAIINANGIWWMSNCEDSVPFVPDYVSSSASSASSASSQGCPIVESMHLTLWFTHMLFVTNQTVVRSLLSRSPLITITDCNNQAAITGDLELDFNLGLLVQDTDLVGGEVMKTINTAGNIERGWVAEGIIAGNEEVEISSTHQRYLDPDDATTDVVHQGIVTVQFASNLAERDIAPQIVYLNDALERDYNNITYLAFPSGRDCEVRMRINVPPAGLPANPVMLIRSQIFGLATGPFSDMTASYRIIDRADVTTQPIAGSTTALSFSSPMSTVTASLPALQVKEIETDEFSITAGCTVFITFTRAAAATPAYSSEIGFMRIGGIIRSAS
jgi:hypothetical protein